MSDVNVLVWHWDEVATIVAVWAAVAAIAGAVAWKWRGRRALIWTLAAVIAGPPALLCGALGLMILAKG